LPEYAISMQQSTGERGDFLSDDCCKRAALITAPDGRLGCLEVELVRQIRAFGYRAGWVQGFRCGDRVAYLECKIWDALKSTESKWIEAALGWRGGG
jgi:hypothetical protein